MTKYNILSAVDKRIESLTGDEKLSYNEKKIERLINKSNSLEQLIGIYRKGLVNLYPDGSFVFISDKGSTWWIENDIQVICASYISEIKLLESEVDELLVVTKAQACRNS